VKREIARRANLSQSDGQAVEAGPVVPSCQVSLVQCHRNSVANAREDTGPRNCDVIDIYEEEGGARRQLGRFVNDWRDHKVHPDPRKPGPGRSDHWFTAIIRAVLGEQSGEDALKQHFVY
jgi:hypothetical protein